MKLPLILIALVCLFSFGCTSIDPNTGEKVYDQVKTAKVRAAFKPFVATTVTAVVADNPETRQLFESMQTTTCSLRDSGTVDFNTIRNAILQSIGGKDIGADPVVLGAANTLIALFEIQYADRLHADLPEEQFVWNLLDVFCEGIGQGLLLVE